MALISVSETFLPEITETGPIKSFAAFKLMSLAIPAVKFVEPLTESAPL